MKIRNMKNGCRLFGIAALVAMIGLAVTACDQPNEPGSLAQQRTVSLIQNHTASDNATVASFVHTNGGQFPASVATPAARSGWSFNGYWTARSGGTQYFNAGGAIIASAAGGSRTLHGDLRLYAQWNQGTPPSGPTPPQQPDVTAPVNIDDIPGLASSGPAVFTLGTTQGGEFTELRMAGRTEDWHGMDIQFPALIAAGDLSATGTYNVRVTGRGGAGATGQFMIQGMQPGHDWGTLVPLAAGQPFTLTRNFTMQAGPAPWAGDQRRAAARLTTDDAGANSEIIFTSIEIVRAAGNVVVFCLADRLNGGTPTPGPPPPPPPQQPDVTTQINIDDIPGFASSGPAVFTLGTTQGGEFVELRMAGRTEDWHGMDIQFPALIAAGDLSATGTYSVRVTGRGGAGATGQFMIQGMQPGHDWGTLVPLAAGQPFTLTRNFTMQAGPAPWASDQRRAAARLTTDDAGANSEIIFTSIEILRVPGNTVVLSLADMVNDGGNGGPSEPWPAPPPAGNITWTATANPGSPTPSISLTFSENPGTFGTAAVTIYPAGMAAVNLVQGTGTSRTLLLGSNVIGGTVSIGINLPGVDDWPRTVTLVGPPGTQPPDPGPSRVLTGTVSITGSPHVGGTLTADISNLSGSGAASFQWRRGNVNMGSATGVGTRLLTTLEYGWNISVVVTRAGYTGSVTSLPVGPVTNAPVVQPELTGTVRITGTPQEGNTLTANTTNLDGRGSASFQWMAGNTTIAGVTGATLRLAAAHVGQMITVTVTRAGHTGSVTSAPVGPVTAAGGGVTVPSAPTGLTATAISASAIQISWGAVSGATSYRVEVRTALAGAWSPLTTVSGTSHTHTGLPANTQRWYRVFAISSAGTSLASYTVTATTAEAPFGLQEAHAAFLQAGGSSYASVFPISRFTWNASAATLSFASSMPGAPDTRGFEVTTGSPASMLFSIEMEVVFNASRQITTVRHRYVISWALGISELNPTTANPHRTGWITNPTVGDSISLPGFILTRNVGQTTSLPFIDGTWRRTN